MARPEIFRLGAMLVNQKLVSREQITDALNGAEAQLLSLFRAPQSSGKLSTHLRLTSSYWHL